jgi:REP element-mobilizing transposase RayT
VTYQRECLFGKIANKEMQLNNYGRIVYKCWQAISNHFPFVELGTYMVMPNHVHGIIVIIDHMDAETSSRTGTIYRARMEQFGKPVIGSIPTIVRTFKAAVTRRIGRELNATAIWQRNYYEHVIRNHNDWDRIHRYLESNPPRWDEDQENPIKRI